MKFSNEAKVTVTVLAAILVMFIGFRIMNDVPIFRQSQKAYTHFDRVDGLSAGSYVYLNGVKVGSVKEIELVSKDSVRVTMNFDLGIDVPKNSKAYLSSSGLLEDKAIVIEPGDSEESIEYEDTIEGAYRSGFMDTFEEEGEKISNNLSDSFDNLNRVLDKVNEVVSEENQTNINQMLTELNAASSEISVLLQEKRGELESSITHANRFMANLDTVSTNNKSRIDSVVVGMDRSLSEIETLTRDLNETNKKLNNILTKIDNGEGTLGQLVNDPSLYNNVDSLSVNINTLIKNINEDPERYLKNMRLIEVF